MEWRFKKMSRDASRDMSCLVEFFNSDLFKDFMIAATGAGEESVE